MRVVVVGGGIAGLAAAHEAQSAGHHTVVLEAEARAGGVLRSERIDGFLCEHAANAVLGAPDGAAALAETLGVEMVAAADEARQRWIWRKGSLRTVPLSPPLLVSSDLLSARGKLRLFAEPFEPRSRSEDETVGAFARRRFGAEATEALVEPFVTGIFAGDIDRLSLAASFPRLAELERKHRSLAVAMFRERGGDRRARVLRAPRDGMDAIPAALARALGGALHTGAPVAKLERRGETWRLPGELEADRLVLAVPPDEAASLVEPHDVTLAGLLRRIETVPAVVVHVGFERKSVLHSLAGFGFLVARNEVLRCLGCVFESSVWPARAPEGQVLLRLIYGGSRDPKIVASDDDTIAALVADDLRRALGVTTPPRILRVVRWTRAIPQYTVGHLHRRDEMAARAKRLGLILAGSAHHGVAVNDCVADRRRVVAEL